MAKNVERISWKIPNKIYYINMSMYIKSWQKDRVDTKWINPFKTIKRFKDRYKFLHDKFQINLDK